MYSIVLAAVLTTGAATPEWGFGHGCFGCHGCCGGCYGCYGCCGGCWGCYGGCYGSYGWSGTYASVPYNFYSCGGCCGAWSCNGCCGTTMPVPKTNNGKPKDGDKDKSKLPNPKPETSAARSATVVVMADPGMRITVNDQPVALKGTEESFTTPDLEPGQKYSYVIKAEGMGNGERTTTIKKVNVVAGQETRVDLRSQATAREAAAKVTVLLPEDARLFVDDVPYPAIQEKVIFETPKLEPERTYYYTLRAELVHDGKVYRDSRRVDLAAGKEVKVEFANLRNASTAQR